MNQSKTWLLVAGLFQLLLLPGANGQTFSRITDPNNRVVTDQFESAGGAWIDIDGDGYLDLFVANGNLSSQNNSLYMNNRHGGFIKVTTGAIVNDGGSSIGSAWGDYDNDGKIDVLVTNRQSIGNFLYRGNGDSTFTKVTTGSVVTDLANSNSSSWVDLDRDGYLDLFVINFQGNEFYYHNGGPPNFTLSRIDTLLPVPDGSAFSISGSWSDINNDRLPDLFVGNAGSSSDFLYTNLGNYNFSKTTLADGRASIGNSWGDYDNDGNPDLFVANTLGQNNILYHTDPGYHLTAVGTGIVSNDGGNSVGSAWGDYDNDGYLDLLVGNDGGNNFLYHNDGPPSYTFTKITVGAIVNDGGNSFGCVWGDYDNDGFLDAFVANRLNQQNFLYHNDGNANHWSEISLTGTISSKTALGAKVRLVATINGTPRRLMREVQAQTGYNSQNIVLHFGLGDAALIDSLKIEWPSGADEFFTNVPVNRLLAVVEQDSTPVSLLLPVQAAVNTFPRVTLRWNKGSYGQPDRVQIAADSSFSGMLYDSTVFDTTLTLDVLSNNSTYYWRVQSARSIHQNVWSAVRKFANQVLPPSAPSINSPANGAGDQPVTLSLRCHPAAAATFYHFQLSADSLFTVLLMDDSTRTDTASQSIALSNSTPYYWHVRAKNIGGASPFSAKSQFTTVIDTPDVPLLSSPANGAEVSTSPVLQWNPAARAASYRLEVSTDSSLFSNPSVSTDSTISRHAGPLSGLTKYFWRVRASNAGGSSSFSTVRNFTTIIGTPALLLPQDGASQLPSVLFTWSAVPGAVLYDAQLGPDSLFNATLIDTAGLSDTAFSANSLSQNMTYYWRVRARGAASVGEWSAARRFTVDLLTLYSNVYGRWNLVSLPLAVENGRLGVLFPAAIQRAFRYEPDSGYETSDSLVNGRGYWLKYAQDAQVTVTGRIVNAESIAVKRGWNLIGSVSQILPVSSISSLPAGLVTSRFFGYADGYTVSDTIAPGKGYWVKVGGDGALILSSQPALAAKIRIVPSDELPPPAPAESGVRKILPAEYALDQNYPNPFNPETNIKFRIPDAGFVSLKVYDLLGREIATIVDGQLPAGSYTRTWQASERSSGVYYYRLEVTGVDDPGKTHTEIRKLLLLK